MQHRLAGSRGGGGDERLGEAGAVDDDVEGGWELQMAKGVKVEW